MLTIYLFSLIIKRDLYTDADGDIRKAGKSWGGVKGIGMNELLRNSG